jgi:riboflavin synthase
MFTGIIESMGEVVSIDRNENTLDLIVRSGISSLLQIDQSVAHDGVCLTIVRATDDTHTVQLVQETLDRTTFHRMHIGDKLNLERSMPANGRFEGHIVQGHIDGVGHLISIENGIYTFSYPQGFAKLIAEKGSICVNGISLTVANLTNDRFGVAIIPHTLANTNFNTLIPGSIVNLEFDILAKHLVRIMDLREQE